MLGVYEKLSRRIVKDEPEPEQKYKDVMEALNPVFFNTPALALHSCYNLLMTMLLAARANVEKSFHLLEHFDEGVYREILAEEDEIDRMTDAVSKYTVEFLPHLQLPDHVAILDQYYKVTGEFERLGDHAVKIAENAASMAKSGTTFSATALSELAVLEDATMNILDETEQTFRKRDVDAARRIEPLVQVVTELIAQLKLNHLKRMSYGECNVYADASFSDLMMEFRRIASVCSNVGVATMVRVNPELADHEHVYYENLHKKGDEAFNAAYAREHKRYFSLLRGASSSPELAGQIPIAESAAPGTPPEAL